MKSPLLELELGTALALKLGPAWLQVDCGEGSWAAWQARELRPTGPDAIVFSSGEASHIAGLYGQLAGMAAAGRSEELRLLHSVEDERVGNLVGAYLQSESSPYPVTLEADWPGAVLLVGGFRLQSARHPLGLSWSIQGGGRRLERDP